MLAAAPQGAEQSGKNTKRKENILLANCHGHPLDSNRTRDQDRDPRNHKYVTNDLHESVTFTDLPIR